MIKLLLIGYLGHDAVKRLVNGHVVLNFRAAHTMRIRNRDGVFEERTIWVDCSFWQHEVLAPYLLKGKRVYVEGMPSIESYVNSQGLTIPVLRLRVDRLELLNGPREDAPSKRDTPDDNAVDVADDLPF
jgi:single-strand DNA-binding protein